MSETRWWNRLAALLVEWLLPIAQPVWEDGEPEDYGPDWIDDALLHAEAVGFDEGCKHARERGWQEWPWWSG